MAIIVEEEKKSSGGFMGFFTWIILIGVIGFATYYIFFKKPEKVDDLIQSDLVGFESIDEISAQKNLKPEEILNNPVFRSLVTDASYPRNVRVGRVNPFLPL